MSCLVVKKIKKKISGYLKNLMDNHCEMINEIAIYNKNNLSYIKDNVTHIFNIEENKIILTRESKEFKSTLIFSLNETVSSKYLIKETNNCLLIDVKTLKINKDDNNLYIKYQVIDSDIIYEYKIVMEDIK